MINRIKDWWHGLWVEHYELTVWFEDQVVTNLEDNTQTTTRSKKVFNLKSISSKDLVLRTDWRKKLLMKCLAF